MGPRTRGSGRRRACVAPSACWPNGRSKDGRPHIRFSRRSQLKAELGADGAIVLRAPANAATTVRRIPGARHDAKRSVWKLPLSWATCVAARGILGDTLEVGPKLTEWARRELAGRVQPALELRGARALPPASPWVVVFDKVEA